MTVALASTAADADPVAAAPLLAYLTGLTMASGPQRLCQVARLATAMASRSTGDLRTCIELTTALLDDAAADDAIDAVNILGVASLLARDEQALRIAVHRALDLQRTSPGLTSVADNAQHRLDLLAGGPSTIDPYIAAAQSAWRITNATLWLTAREAIDAGAGHSAIRGVRAGRRRPTRTSAGCRRHGRRDRRREQLAHRAPHCRRAQPPAHCRRRAGRVGRRRSSEQSSSTACGSSPLPNIYVTKLATSGASNSNWRPSNRRIGRLSRPPTRTSQASPRRRHSNGATQQATRSGRGRRKRPRHGWLSLTPTELQVARMVAEGRTNPQIAERLLMGRATVKTHLEHIFPKLGVTTRADSLRSSPSAKRPTGSSGGLFTACLTERTDRTERRISHADPTQSCSRPSLRERIEDSLFEVTRAQ